MNDNIQVLDTVALLRGEPGLSLHRGQVGAVVEELDDATVLVEFVNPDGTTFALPAVPRRNLLKLAFGHLAAE